MAAALTPVAPVIAVDVSATRLQLASGLGATHTVNPTDGDPVAALLELTRGLGAQYAFDQINVAAQDAAEARTIKPVMILPT